MQKIMNEIYYHAIYADGSSKCYDQRSALTESDKSVLFYVKEKRNQSFSYGHHSDYSVINSYGNPATYIYGENKLLRRFATSGTAAEFILTLELQNLSGDSRLIKLVTDARFNLSYNCYQYREWDNYNIFASIISYLYEVEKYGEEGYNLITHLRKECWDKNRDFSNLKQENNILTQQVEILKNSTKEAVIPGDITFIEESCFAYSKSIEKVVLHENITYICDYAFKLSSNLKEVYCKATTPPFIGFDAFFKIAQDAKIYVPMQSVEAYKNNTGWKVYQDKIVGYDYDE